MTVFLQEQIQIQEVTEMFCNFDCASLLKLLCGIFGGCRRDDRKAPPVGGAFLRGKISLHCVRGGGAAKP